MLDGATFLPAEVMISSFLRSTIERKPSSSIVADVAAVYPAVGVEEVPRSPPGGGGSPAVVIGPRISTSPSSAISELDAWQGRPDGAEPELPGPARRRAHRRSRSSRRCR